MPSKNMRRAETACRSIDIFGEPISLSLNGEQTYKTKVGSLCSLVVFTLVIAYSVQKVERFVTRGRPEIISFQNKIKPLDFPEINLGN